MRWLIDGFLKARVPVVVIAAALLFVGYKDVRDMPVDTLPEFGPTTVEIQTEALGLSANEVEQLITVPMEQDLLNGVAWLKYIRSNSSPGRTPFNSQVCRPRSRRCMMSSKRPTSSTACSGR